MILNRETAARDALRMVHAGMQFAVAPEDWTTIREALDAQATVWESEGVHPIQVALLRTEMRRHDRQGPLSRTGMIALEV